AGRDTGGPALCGTPLRGLGRMTGFGRARHRAESTTGGRRFLVDARPGAGALVAAGGAAVRHDCLRGEELQAGVDVGDSAQAPGGLVEVHLENRKEALQVGLLVDRELSVARRQELLRDRREVVAAALDLALEAELLDRLEAA